MLTMTRIFWKSFFRNTSKIKSLEGDWGWPLEEKIKPEQFEATKVDLGEDLLLEESQVSIQEEPLIKKGDSIEDELASAQILIAEGLTDEAKKILRKILIQDPHYLAAKQRLDEIHEIELKQIFREEDAFPKRRDKTQTKTSHVNSDEIMRKLDRDLQLGIFSERIELELFQNKEALEAFTAQLEKEFSGTSAQDRVDLGIGFLEMGLYDLAARQFRSAIQDPGFALTANSLLAYTLVLANRPFEAVLLIEPILEDSELSREEKIHFLYLMGRAHERLMKPQVATQWYLQVKEIDPAYRDIEERLRAR